MRIAWALGLAALLSVSVAAARAEARVKVAVAEFQVEGATSPALSQQLQEGLQKGLARSGIQVVEAAEAAKLLEAHPELQKCDTSACLKSLGQLLDVRYVVRVRVDAAGNTYKAAARVFSTEGATPPELPVMTRSKACDVCTVAEAREALVRLGDTMRLQLEEPVAAAPPPPPPPPPPPKLAGPIVAAMVGALTLAAGFAVLSSNGDCTATACDENRTRSAVGGALIGAGAAVAVMGTYVTVMRSRGAADPVTGVAVAFRW
jgi:TolB-like protein